MENVQGDAMSWNCRDFLFPKQIRLLQGKKGIMILVRQKNHLVQWDFARMKAESELHGFSNRLNLLEFTLISHFPDRAHFINLPYHCVKKQFL